MANVMSYYYIGRWYALADVLLYDVLVGVITTEDVITSIWPRWADVIALLFNVADDQTTSCYNILVWQIFLPR